jgi:GDPmannose 4,6-dehydratase
LDQKALSKALIIGSAGQDGWFLSQHLRATDQEVWELSRQSLIGLEQEVLPPVDIGNQGEIASLIERIEPDHIYYLAAKHHSASDPDIHADDLLAQSHAVHVTGLQHVLDAMHAHVQHAKLFYAASSHLFAGHNSADPINEQTPFSPKGIYADTKLAGVQLCRQYRDEKYLFAASGFLFNHESWRRSPRFLSRKIIQSVVQIVQGQQDHLVLHDLSAQVDWSFAGDTVRAMRAMLELDEPHDLVIASGKLHSVREFAEIAFAIVGLDWRDYVTEEPQERQKPGASHPLLGDNSRLRARTDWQPKVSFSQMIELMIEMELSH